MRRPPRTEGAVHTAGLQLVVGQTGDRLVNVDGDGAGVDVVVGEVHRRAVLNGVPDVCGRTRRLHPGVRRALVVPQQPQTAVLGTSVSVGVNIAVLERAGEFVVGHRARVSRVIRGAVD